MDSDDADREELANRVDELEATVSKMLPGRRGVLKGLGAAAIGGAAVGGATGGASGQSAAGQVGTSTAPVDVVANSLTATEMITTQGRGFLGLPNHHINYEAGLATEEIVRFSVAAGNKLEVWRLETKLKGDGTNADFSVDVYDATNATVLASTSGKVTGGSSPIGTSGAGATIIVRVTNNTGAAQDACITGLTSIVIA